MNPKNIDRVGKGILGIIALSIATAAKKFGPKIIDAVKKFVGK